MKKAHETTNYFLQKAFDVLHLEEKYQDLLRASRREVTVELIIPMDDGGVGHFTGYRVQHDNSRGPYKGGLRYHPELDMDEARSLASLMTWKTALANLPFGGAKGGIQVDPKTLSERELERLTRRFVNQIHEFIGPRTDIPAPDMNTDARVMAWIFDEYSQRYGWSPAVVTGKPVDLRGSFGREAATGRGCVYAIGEVLKRDGKEIEGSVFAVQGFGKVGYWAAHLLHQAGGKIIAVSDAKGGIYKKDGLDIPAVFEYSKRAGTVVGMPDVELISNENLLKLECDVLVPAAIGHVINEENASQIKAGYVLEGANAPCTAEGDEVLNHRGIMVIPDIFANCGGVTVSYFEWTQNLQEYRWNEKTVNSELQNNMLQIHRDLRETMEQFNVSMRTAAYIRAVQRVQTATAMRGLE